MLTFSHNIEEVLSALDDVERKQVPQALVWALNDMAAEALKGVQEDMEKHFDRPTRWTKNAFMVWRATKRTLAAEMKERPSVGPRHYLKVQERGGPRPQTGLEKLFGSRVQYAGVIQSVIPAAAARLDAFGNWSSGERNQVLSSLQAQRDARSNTTERSAKRARGRARYFVPSKGLAPGVWKATDAKSRPQKVLHFSAKSPSYQPRLGFVEGVNKRVVKGFEDHFGRALQKALATAK